MSEVRFSKDKRKVIDANGAWGIKSHIVESVMTKFSMKGKGTSDNEYMVHRGSLNGYKQKIADGYKPDYTHHKIFAVQETHTARGETPKHRIMRNFQLEELKNGKLINTLEDSEINNNSDGLVEKAERFPKFKEYAIKTFGSVKTAVIILSSLIGAAGLLFLIFGTRLFK